ncbi:MAG: serine/threonine-protein kinase [Verrucomicrobiales bacterium]|nr:serine/threonine-protein kinase [Verrucomicrobiales bacterium]
MTKFNIRDQYNGYHAIRDPDGSASILGKGKFGVTIRATRPDLGQDYAIKILHDDIASTSSGKNRFLREIRALRYLEHGNLVKYLGADTTEEGDMFLIMELCEGGSLSDFVATHGSLSERTVARIALQVARGLRETHSKGFLHRDLKPSNLLLAKHLISKTELDIVLTEDPSLVKVADFGLVGHLTDEGKVKRGRFGGTVLFASPEQFQERSLDIRSDFYSLGMAMWFLACGGNPFKTEGGKVDFKVASRRHTDDTPHVESPSMKALGLSSEFLSLLGKLLAKDREERLPDADAVEKSILRFLRKSAQTAAMAGREDGSDSTASDDWGRGQITDFYKIDHNLSDFRNRAVTLKGLEIDTGQEYMLTVWKSSDDPMSTAERNLGRYLNALSRFSRKEEVGSALIPIRSVRRTSEEWCVAEPVIRGIPLSSYFEEDRKADPHEIMETLAPVAETIDEMSIAGFNRGCLSADSVFIVPDEDSDEYFVEGRWAEEAMKKWPEWKVMFSGISSPPQIDADRISSDPSFGTSSPTATLESSDDTSPEMLETLLTQTELLPTVSLTQTDREEDSTLIEFKGTPLHNTVQISSESRTGVITKDRIDSAGELSLFRNFCNLVFRLFAGREVATAARWAPGAYVPTPNLTDASNRLLQEHISGSGGMESASALFARILQMEGLDEDFENLSTAILEEEVVTPAVDTSRYRKRKSTAAKTVASTKLINFAGVTILLFFIGIFVWAAFLYNPSQPQDPTVAEQQPPPKPVVTLDENDVYLTAAKDPKLPVEKKVEYLKKAAAGLEKAGERERSRAAWMQLAGVVGTEQSGEQAEYLAQADELAPLGIDQWTYIYENSSSPELREKYKKRSISYLAGTDPEEAFSRLMEFADNTDNPQEKIRFWKRGTSLPNIPKGELRKAYESIAEQGGFDERVNLYDFLRASSSYQQEALIVGKEIALNGSDENLPVRIKIATELWDRFNLVEALQFTADHLPEGTEKQKYRWEYYSETQDPGYADAARRLAESDQLSARDRGRYAWRFFETLPLKQRETEAARLMLAQAIDSEVNEAVVYRERSNQIEESRKAAEAAKQAALEAIAAAKRIDNGLKEIAAKSIERDGMLDKEAYNKKMAELSALIAETEKVKKSARIELQKSSIYWRKFITWEEATGLQARRTPYTGRANVTKQIDPTAYSDLEEAAKLGNLDAKARLASILAGANPVKPPSPDIEKAAQLAGEVYQSDGVGRTEAKLVLRHLLKGDREVKRKASRILESMNIDSTSVMN